MLKQLFKHTFFYGLSGVLPRLLTFLLTPFYVNHLPSVAYFGEYSILMVYLILGNILLSYGMETTYFRFINKYQNDNKVRQTALTSIIITTVLFAAFSLFFSRELSVMLDHKPSYVRYAIGILCFDALSVIPFAHLRQQQQSKTFAVIKIGNVCVNILLNMLFFLALGSSYFPDKLDAILLALLIPSLLTLIVLCPVYLSSGLCIDLKIWKEMMRYSFPVLISGVAFAVNESFDKLFLRHMLPGNTADGQVGIYSACYKMGIFMTLFVTSFKMGIEPFFFQQSQHKNAQKRYAVVTYYFTLTGAVVLIFASVYTPFIKSIIIPKATYWEGLWIVPIILLANLCLGIYHNLSVWYKATDKTRFGAYFSIIGGLVTVISNIVLIPKMGYKGSAIATLGAYGIMMILSYVIGQRRYPIPYRIKKMMVIVGISIVLSFSYFYFSEHSMLLSTTIFLLFLVSISYLERSQLKKIFNK